MAQEIKSVARAAQILDLFTTSGSQLGVSQIAESLSVNKSAVSRLMATLETKGIVTKKPGCKKYCLGRKVVELAGVFLSNIDLKAVASPHLRELNERTGELAALCVMEGDRRRCIQWVESPATVRYVMDERAIEGPVHAGAPGKLLLAYLPDEQIAQLTERTGLPRYTDTTITNIEELRREIRKIRENGVAFSTAEHIRLASSVAAPIRNHLGKVVAALTIMWITADADCDMEEKCSGLVRESANKISWELGYQEAS